MIPRTSAWPIGMPCWAELAVPDVERASRYYAGVLGWHFAPTTIEFGRYLIAQTPTGEALAALAPLPSGAHPAWTLYLAADDVDRVAVAVSEHGGRLLAPAHDVEGRGRVLIAADPDGARFAVWQAGHHIGAEVVNATGGLVWERLRAPDPAASAAFYAGVFGYRTTSGSDGGQMLWLDDGEAPVGAIAASRPDPGPGTGPGSARWEVYFAVEDAGAAVAAAAAGTDIGPASTGTGAEPGRTGVVAVHERVGAGPAGLTAELRDPFGAGFHVLQPR